MLLQHNPRSTSGTPNLSPQSIVIDRIGAFPDTSLAVNTLRRKLQLLSSCFLKHACEFVFLRGSVLYSFGYLGGMDIS